MPTNLRVVCFFNFLQTFVHFSLLIYCSFLCTLTTKNDGDMTIVNDDMRRQFFLAATRSCARARAARRLPLAVYCHSAAVVIKARRQASKRIAACGAINASAPFLSPPPPFSLVFVRSFARRRRVCARFNILRLPNTRIDVTCARHATATNSLIAARAFQQQTSLVTAVANVDD